LGFEV